MLAIIIMLIPVFRDKMGIIYLFRIYNKFIFGLGAIILSVSQVISSKRDQKEGEKLTIRHFGNAIAFGIMFLLDIILLLI